MFNQLLFKYFHKYKLNYYNPLYWFYEFKPILNYNFKL